MLLQQRTLSIAFTILRIINLSLPHVNRARSKYVEIDENLRLRDPGFTADV